MFSSSLNPVSGGPFCALLPGACCKHEETRDVGLAAGGWDRMSGFEVYDSIEKHIRGLQQRQQQQTEPGWYTVIAISSLRKPQSGLRLSARKTPATSTAIQNRTAGLSCQTSVTAMARCEFIHQIAKRFLAGSAKLRLWRREKQEANRAAVNLSLFFFCRSTDRAANEPFFLKRFTFFQQGKSLAHATLATPRGMSVQPAQKSKQHFA